MSRRELTTLPHRQGYQVHVGWDRPLGSYFATVINLGIVDETSPDALPVWLGAMERVTDPTTVIEAVRPYAVIPENLRAELEADRSREGTRTRPGWAHTAPASFVPAPLHSTGVLSYQANDGTRVTCAVRMYRTGPFSVAAVVTDTPTARTDSRVRPLLRLLTRRTIGQRPAFTDHAAGIHAALCAAFDGQHVEHIEYTPHGTGEAFHAFHINQDGTSTRTPIEPGEMLRRFGADVSQ